MAGSREELLAAVFHSASEAMSIIGLDGTILAWNPAAEKLFGYSQAEAVGALSPQVNPDGSPSESARAIEALRRGEKVVEQILPRVSKDGQPLYISITFSPLVVAGELRAVLTASRDVTERHRMAEELQHREREQARLASLVETTHDAVFSRDREGRILTWNRAAEQLYEYTAEEAVGQLWTMLIPPDRLSFVKARANTVSPERPLIDSHNVNVTKSGRHIHVSVTVSPIRGADGEEIGASVIARDLTERHHAEEVARTLAAKEEQLRASQKMEAIGSLAGGVAHDFNNLLTVILASSALALGRLSVRDPMYRELTEIQAAAERAAALTRQLLTFSRHRVLQLAVLDVGSVVGELEPMLRRLIGEDVELLLSSPSGLPPVTADRDQLGQVLVNLVANARDAMPGGGRLGIEVSVCELDAKFASTHLGVKSGRHVMLKVSDSGQGMDSETKARIFEPFFTTKGERGTGLGLAMVFGIVKQFDGTIWVDSEPGKGTSFSIYLPCSDKPLRTFKEPSTPKVLHGAETILLVEDEPAVRAVVRAVLQNSGYCVLDAQGPGDALILSEQHEGKIHLLLTDVVMPRMSGPQLAKRLLETRPGMRVIYMSGYTGHALMNG
ncbi:MAG: PAS domain-containing hybrid sensor histidine kinase/response regulator, partial [Polyangiales bacterium]